MNDMITIFNQLTHNELADCQSFENIIKNHFMKFKLVYSYMKYLDFSLVNKITCKDDKKGLSIKINYKNGYIGSLFEGIKSDNFIIETQRNENIETINIFDIDKGEVEKYENRFNRRQKIYNG